jgi:hypothetical protein
MATANGDYDKYMRILDITLRTCATMLSIIFAYTLASQKMAVLLQAWVTVTVVFLTVTILLSGIGIILAKRSEPTALKGLALFSFFMMIALILAMLVLLLLAIWHS